MTNLIQTRIDNFFIENKSSRRKSYHKCIKNKKTCPYTDDGDCRGWCVVKGKFYTEEN